MLAEVYYAKDVNQMVGFSPLPLARELEVKYAKVCDIDDHNIDSIFSKLNWEPRKYIEYPLPEGILHTSMSVGDIIKFADGELWYCSVLGWDLIT